MKGFDKPSLDKPLASECLSREHHGDRKIYNLCSYLIKNEKKAPISVRCFDTFDMIFTKKLSIMKALRVQQPTEENFHTKADV